MRAIILLILFIPIIVEAEDYGTIKNVTFLYCYDGDTCRFDIPHLHPIIGKNIPVRLKRIDTLEIRGKCGEKRSGQK
jgi:micrococcal nuclease